MKPNREPLPSQPSWAESTVRLILIEDSDTDAYLISESARELSYDLKIQRFVTVAQAIHGLEAGFRDAPHGALLDLNLPGGSGLDVLRSIRNNEETRNLRVVVLTSSNSVRDREAAERLGVEGYLNKPSEYLQFVSTIGVALRLILNVAAPA
jgi:CheY-like chemotaxis protein